MKLSTIVLLCSMGFFGLLPSIFASSSPTDNSNLVPPAQGESPNPGETQGNHEWCKNNPDACKAKREERRQWCQAHPDECKAKREEWCQNHPQECKDRASKWCANHPSMCNQIKGN